jgi:hypothetical protein
MSTKSSRAPLSIPVARATTTGGVSERTPDEEPTALPAEYLPDVLPQPRSEKRNPSPDAKSLRPTLTPIPPVDCPAKMAQAEKFEQAAKTVTMVTTCGRSAQSCCATALDWSAELKVSASSAMTTGDLKGQPGQNRSD